MLTNYGHGVLLFLGSHSHLDEETVYYPMSTTGTNKTIFDLSGTPVSRDRKGHVPCYLLTIVKLLMSQLDYNFEPTSLSLTEVSLAATCTIQDVFAAVAQTDGALLLDSGASQESGSRFDIALWQPLLTLTSKQGETRVASADGAIIKKFRGDHSPLKVAQSYIQAFQLSVDTSEVEQSLYNTLPMVLGLAGFCSYDLGRYFETLPSLNPAEYECPDMMLGIYDRALIHDTHTNRWYFCHTSGVAVPDFNNWLNASCRAFRLTTPWQSNLTQTDYNTALGKVHDYLTAGDCYQVNFAQRFKAGFSGDVWPAYRLLTQANNAPFSAFLNTGNSTLLSLSPERFIQCRDGIIETKPIKGTRPRSTDPIQDERNAAALLSAEKDRAENLMIVDLLRNDISKHSAPGSVSVPDLFKLESYAAVHHMVSRIRSRLSADSHPLDLLQGCFPGGSITGAPKIRAMEIIEELEPNRRAPYCGSMVYLGLKNDLDSSICIRTLLAEQNQLYCWAGGGIVLDSVANEEFQETLDKVARILPVLESTIEKA
ncbi:aminodeoxychorismate synthase component I [Alteromonas gilva]|uniref:aminodeoxychorismate synthase n=1 Tax=Alteromonas gilva TaxID=2987522 RepID=A0ABT5L1V2_9ALTE|nr:aminodeoxychorismate synthase component I [Alteromonas gilva]MDC8831019.1 aminodeoxychorismate synthase component I [Alteromonas gilva]